LFSTDQNRYVKLNQAIICRLLINTTLKGGLSINCQLKCSAKGHRVPFVFMNCVTPILVLTALVGVASCARAPQPKVVGYYTSWSVYDRDFQVSDIRGTRLTHLSYASANISSGGKCVLGDPCADIGRRNADQNISCQSGGNIAKLAELRQQHSELKLLLSVGGWGRSAKFSDVARTAASRALFAESCGQLMREFDFDGLDIDWEYPVTGGLQPGRPEDKDNFVHLLAALRQQLDSQEGEHSQRHYLLTIAGPAGLDQVENLKPADAHSYVDWINVMAYDFRGAWSPLTGFLAPLYDPQRNDPHSNEGRGSAHAAIEAYLAAGVPPDKLLLGVPFYGRGWEGVPPNNHGLFQAHSGAADGGREDGVFDYRHLVRDHVQRMTRYWHERAKAPWLYDPVSRLMISYEDVESVRAKVDYVRRRRLGGIMVWELSQDTDDGTSLLETIWRKLRTR
jgi:chitinase